MDEDEGRRKDTEWRLDLLPGRMRMGMEDGLGGWPQGGGEAGGVSGGRRTGLRQWTETESVIGPNWSRKKWGERLRTVKGTRVGT